MFAQVSVVYTGPIDGSYATSGNWSGNIVPLNGGGADYSVTIGANLGAIFFDPASGDHTVSSLALGTETSLLIQNGNSLTVLGNFSMGSANLTLVEAGGEFVANGPGTVVMNGCSISVFYNCSAAIALTNYTSPLYFNKSFAAEGNSFLDLSSLQSLSPGGPMYVIASGSSVVDLSGLVSSVQSGDQETIFAAHSDGIIDLTNLTSLTRRHRFDINGGGSRILHGPMVKIDDLSIVLVGGATFGGLSATSYASSSVGRTYFSAVGAGTMLDLGTIKTMVSRGQTSIDAAHGGAVDLSALTISTQSGSRVTDITYFTADHGTIDLSSLTEIRGRHGFIVKGSNGHIFHGGLDNVDDTSLFVGEGATLAPITATSFTTSPGEIFIHSFGPGSILDLSTIEFTENADATIFQASFGGVLDLSGLTQSDQVGESVTTFVTNGGYLDLRSLSVLSGAHVVSVSDGGTMILGSPVFADEISFSVFSSTGSVSRAEVGGLVLAHQDSSLSIDADSQFVLSGDYSFAATVEGAFDTTKAVVSFKGSKPQIFEVGGVDIGPVDPANNGNFGFGRFEIGSPNAPVSVVLTDYVDNGNRENGLFEALYLFGSGGKVGLELFGGSELFMGEIPIFVRTGSSWLDLRTLFAPGETRVPFSGGFLNRAATFFPAAGETNLVAGNSVSFSVFASGGSIPSFQWQFQPAGSGEWSDLEGATSDTYHLPSVQRFHNGNYRVMITTSGQVQYSEVAALVVSAPGPSASRLTSLSTRAMSLTGDDVIIPGFVIEGTGMKRLLIRAVGPTLGKSPFDIGGVLPDPILTLKKWNAAAFQYDDVMVNDNWVDHANASEIAAAAANLYAFELQDSLEGALLVDLDPGQYTAIASGVGGTTGLAIVELYDADTNAMATLTSIANRGFAGVGNEVMIPGFVVSSEGPKTFLIRAVGPTLGADPFNVSGTMADPELSIYHRDSASGVETLYLRNDDWNEFPDSAYTAQISAQVSAFDLSAGSADASVVVTLNPGIYTVVASSADGVSTGVVLVEVYVVE